MAQLSARGVGNVQVSVEALKRALGAGQGEIESFGDGQD
jgi:hypothetical protein